MCKFALVLHFLHYHTAAFPFSLGKTSKDLERSSNWGPEQIDVGMGVKILWCHSLYLAHGGEYSSDGNNHIVNFNVERKWIMDVAIDIGKIYL